MQNIYGFWHIGRVGDWKLIIEQQLPRMKKSGLYDASTQIIVGYIGGAGHLDELPDEIKNDPKFYIFTTRDREDFEFPTLERARFMALYKETPFYMYYIHTKGASSACITNDNAVNTWRMYMEYFIIDKWKDCYEKVQTYDLCGVEWELDNHFSGNFWWSRSDYIKQLPEIVSFWENARGDRMPAELWHGCSNRRRVFCFNDFKENLYSYKIPKERYEGIL
jgi:hypothetical protein